MRCERCGAEIHDAGKTCPECGHSFREVEVLTPEEREGFQGITIESPGSRRERDEDYSYEYHDPEKRVYVRRFNLNTGPGGLLNRILTGLIIAGVLFLAFPILFLVFRMFFVIIVAVALGGLLSLTLRRR
jgi:hypothetical protein